MTRVIISHDIGGKFSHMAGLVAEQWRGLGFSPHVNAVGPEGWLGIPVGHVAKISRMISASELPGISILSDADMLPLRRQEFDFLVNAVTRWDKSLYCYGADAYASWAQGRFPICYLAADQRIWRDIVNPLHLARPALLETWRGLRGDGKADPWRAPFSDESLLAELLRRWTGDVIGINRGWTDGIADARLDRSCWRVDPARLASGEYIDAHMPRLPPADMERLIKGIRG